MVPVVHLKSLQALEMAIREGSLKAAAARLGITPAAVGQRIRTLEVYLGTDLLLRGRSGLLPTPELDQALADLRLAFAALDRATQALDFQRLSEIHIVADHDWADLWLQPRIGTFQRQHPGIRFCINGLGQVPTRLGAPDLRITCDEGPGEVLFRDLYVPVSGPDNTRRIAGWDAAMPMEGMPLIHLKARRDGGLVPGWVDWFAAFGQREKGNDRGVHYQGTLTALEAVRNDVGFLVCGLALALQDVAAGSVVLPFPPQQHIAARQPYRLALRSEAESRPQVARFLSWLRTESAQTTRQLAQLIQPD